MLQLIHDINKTDTQTSNRLTKYQDTLRSGCPPAAVLFRTRPTQTIALCALQQVRVGMSLSEHLFINYSIPQVHAVVNKQVPSILSWKAGRNLNFAVTANLYLYM